MGTIKEIFLDKDGNVSHSRVISIFVAISACVVIWKLTWMGGMNEYYFGLYLLYGTGHQTINKFLDIVSAVKLKGPSNVQ